MIDNATASRPCSQVRGAAQPTHAAAKIRPAAGSGQYPELPASGLSPELEELRIAYGKIPPLSASETRRHLKWHVPHATEENLDRALYLAGHCDNGRA